MSLTATQLNNHVNSDPNSNQQAQRRQAEEAKKQADERQKAEVKKKDEEQKQLQNQLQLSEEAPKRAAERSPGLRPERPARQDR